jgi:DNA-binding response OmpR family regulator
MTRPILIVEDDPDLADVMEAALLAAGYEVRIACDGLDALAKVQQQMPQLILLDMCMPRMDGWEFAAAFSQRHGDRVPIVVVTAAEQARQRGAMIGARDVLAKPFSLAALCEIVTKHAGTT